VSGGSGVNERELKIFTEYTWMVLVTFTVGSSRQSTVRLEDRPGGVPLKAYSGQCDSQLGCARCRPYLRSYLPLRTINLSVRKVE